MIDIHCHLLPGVDDGPKEIEQSLVMIAQGVKDGISAIVATPHILGPLDDDEFPELCQQKLEELRKRLDEQGVNLRLFLGSEIFFQFSLASICRRRLGTLAGNGKYPLIEFPLNSLPHRFEEELFRLQLSGFMPIIAHPERNMMLARDVKKLFELSRRGILFQVNARSLTGGHRKAAKKVAERLVAEGAAQFVASDAHNSVSRPLILSQARRAVEKLVGAETAEELFYLNPQRAIQGENISSLYY
ncbi:MAG: hypothetical protein KAT86_01825 [Candidatus Latescibacteria bacterium]|nr:hypothetical protein [Candidatus Latescibacterota bacterium]